MTGTGIPAARQTRSACSRAVPKAPDTMRATISWAREASSAVDSRAPYQGSSPRPRVHAPAAAASTSASDTADSSSSPRACSSPAESRTREPGGVSSAASAARSSSTPARDSPHGSWRWCSTSCSRRSTASASARAGSGSGPGSGGTSRGRCSRAWRTAASPARIDAGSSARCRHRSPRPTCASRRCSDSRAARSSEQTSTLRPSERAATTTLATVWVAPVPAGVSSTRSAPREASSTTSRWARSASSADSSCAGSSARDGSGPSPGKETSTPARAAATSWPASECGSPVKLVTSGSLAHGKVPSTICGPIAKPVSSTQSCSRAW
ncbi:hypothetical protein [Ornithinimicrobium kibberense]|uniref:hypothetical protein n=1 Tax=Ornithinimicrobium kibberense TaxID=282060 RepID=UPI00361998FC